MTDLLPCPFCGGSDILTGVYYADGAIERKGAVRCDDCGARAPAASWSRRITAPAQTVSMRAIANDCRAASSIYRGRPTQSLAADSVAEIYSRIAESIDLALAAQPPAAPVVPHDVLTAFGVATTQTGVEPQRRWEAAEKVRKFLASLTPAAPVETERKTFTIPPGYEAVRDSEGRATGEARPQSSAATEQAVWLAKAEAAFVLADEIKLRKQLTVALRDLLAAVKTEPAMQGRQFVQLGIQVTNALHAADVRERQWGGTEAQPELPGHEETMENLNALKVRE